MPLKSLGSTRSLSMKSIKKGTTFTVERYHFYSRAAVAKTKKVPLLQSILPRKIRVFKVTHKAFRVVLQKVPLLQWITFEAVSCCG